MQGESIPMRKMLICLSGVCDVFHRNVEHGNSVVFRPESVSKLDSVARCHLAVTHTGKGKRQAEAFS